MRQACDTAESAGADGQRASRTAAAAVVLDVHRMGASDVTMPFGGVGVGRGHGRSALDACTELQVIADHVDVSGFSGPGAR